MKRLFKTDNIIKLIIGFLLIIFLSTSCSRKRMVFLQKDEVELAELEYEYPKKDIDYKIRPHDVLQITVTSYNKEVAELFNKNRNNRNNQNNNQNNRSIGNFYFSGYTVNDTGFIKLPIIGHLNVLDMTINEVNKMVQESADEYLEDADVTVRFVSFKVTFMGEVGSPGVKLFYQDKLNFLEAITMAGGITPYGDRQNILVVRPTQDGHKTYRVDLTKREILSSEKLYLLPNDIVYVEPINIKTIRMDVADLFYYITTITSLITTSILILQYVNP